MRNDLTVISAAYKGYFSIYAIVKVFAKNK